MAFYTQKIANNLKTEITATENLSSFDSVIITNTHTSKVTIDLYVTDQTGASVTDSTVLVAKASATSTGAGAFYDVTESSLTIAVDTVNATSDVFLNERVYDINSGFYGVCTAVPGTTSLTFADGIQTKLLNNVNLHTGTRFYLSKDLVIPTGVSLKLDSNEFSFASDKYKMYIKSDHASGKLDIILR